VAELEAEARAAAGAVAEATGRLAGMKAAEAAARERFERAAAEAETAAALDPEAPCPLCGQELGACFEDVRHQRAAARAEADAALRAVRDELAAAQADLAEAGRRAADAEANLAAARKEEGRHAAARAELAAARAQRDELEAALDPPPRPDETAAARLEVAGGEAARDEALRLRERLARAGAVEASLVEERARLAEADQEARRLLEQGRTLGFDPTAHATALAARQRAREALAEARSGLMEARLAERGLFERLAERRSRLAAEIVRRGELAAREEEARYLGRLAELLGEFRNRLVGQVGPALSIQTTALFRELTDGRFDRLDVDPETFELVVGTAGAGHPLLRHSGSETDLANLSLRIAIGEQVHLLSGGQVGLLVLDEVLGSLDGEHRDRLLDALTRLGARFRQVLVVTHAAEMKEQLPAAIEVVPLARGRSLARVANVHVQLAGVA
jgi:DNA repair exonuclease SbcCD ATPase subunit